MPATAAITAGKVSTVLPVDAAAKAIVVTPDIDGSFMKWSRKGNLGYQNYNHCLLYTSPSPRD